MQTLMSVLWEHASSSAQTMKGATLVTVVQATPCKAMEDLVIVSLRFFMTDLSLHISRAWPFLITPPPPTYCSSGVPSSLFALKWQDRIMHQRNRSIVQFHL